MSEAASHLEVDHDASLVDWFLDLTPAQRLAELESRIAFFTAGRRALDAKLHQDSTNPRPPRG